MRGVGHISSGYRPRRETVGSGTWTDASKPLSSRFLADFAIRVVTKSVKRAASKDVSYCAMLLTSVAAGIHSSA